MLGPCGVWTTWAVGITTFGVPAGVVTGVWGAIAPTAGVL
jgi:hypothetical protein